jgi:TonB family protein
MIKRIAFLLTLFVLAGAAFGQAHSKLQWASETPIKIPPDAKGLSGKVVLSVSISETGDVTDATYESGDEGIAPYAIAAVKQWKAKPYIMNGKAIPVHVNLPLTLGTPSNLPVLSEKDAKPTKTVIPDYPAQANQANIRGAVMLKLLVGTDGKVKSSSVVVGQALLNDAAKQAVQHWEFKPYQVNGKPSEFETTVTVNFKPSDQ